MSKMKLNTLQMLSLLALQYHFVLPEAISHHLSETGWLKHKLESIRNINMEKVHKQNDDIKHIDDSSQKVDIERRCNDWYCADTKAHNVTRTEAPTIMVYTVENPNPVLERQTQAIPTASVIDTPTPESSTGPPTMTSVSHTLPLTPPLPPQIIEFGQSETTAKTTEASATSGSSLKTKWKFPSLTGPKSENLGRLKRPGYFWLWNRLKHHGHAWNSSGLKPGKTPGSINKLKTTNKAIFLNRIKPMDDFPYLRLKIEVYLFLKRRGVI